MDEAINIIPGGGFGAGQTESLHHDARHGHDLRTGNTVPDGALTADDARLLFAGIDTRQLVGLRDRALIATMFYTFARVSATIALKVEDYYAVGRDYWIRLHEKGGRENCVLDELKSSSELLSISRQSNGRDWTTGT